MPYAECRNCTKIMTRSGGRGVKLADMCCPFCGADIKSASTPAELRGEHWLSPVTAKYQHAPQAIAKWLYEARKAEPDWLNMVRGSVTLTKAQAE